jgi:hypothetical protein
MHIDGRSKRVLGANRVALRLLEFAVAQAFTRRDWQTDRDASRAYVKRMALLKLHALFHGRVESGYLHHVPVATTTTSKAGSLWRFHHHVAPCQVSEFTKKVQSSTYEVKI